MATLTLSGGTSAERNCPPKIKKSIRTCQGRLNGGVSNGGVSRTGLFCPFLSFFVLLGIFPICPGTLRGFSRFLLFLFLGLLTAPTRNSPERVRDTIWTFPEKSGKPPGLETPRGFSFSQLLARKKTQKRIRKRSETSPNALRPSTLLFKNTDCPHHQDYRPDFYYFSNQSGSKLPTESLPQIILGNVGFGCLCSIGKYKITDIQFTTGGGSGNCLGNLFLPTSAL